MKQRVMIVEDETHIVTMLKYNLEKAGFEVFDVRDGEDALPEIAKHSPDAVLLDWGLPSMSGYEVCREIRRSAEFRGLAVIMLTARGEEAEKIRALDAGADDYVTKPFSISELIARLHAVLRRLNPKGDDAVLSFAGISMDPANHRVTRNDRQIHLGPKEYRLLKFLLERPRRVFSREQLLDAVWGFNIYVENRTVDVHIRRLRQALNVGDEPDVVRTVRSAGYSLEEPEASKSFSIKKTPPRAA